MSRNISKHPIEQEELMAYLDSELAADHAADTAAHLERCEECRRLAADLQDVSRQMAAWQVPSSAAKVSRAMTAALEERANSQKSSRRLSFRMLRYALGTPRLVWAGGFAVVLFGMLMVGTPKRLTSSHGPQMEIHPYFGNGEPLQDTNGPPKRQAGPVGVGPGKSGQIGKLTPDLSPAPSLREQADTAFSLDGKPAVDGKSAGPMIVRTAQLALTTPEFDKARTSAEEILKRHRGYIGQMNVSTPNEAGRTMSATFRVPADQLDAALAELKRLGRVISESQSGEEITQQYVDLEARLSNARNTEQRLTELLRQRTGKLSDVLAVENELARVRGEIESMDAERKMLAKQVTFATLNTTLTEDYSARLQVVPPSTSTRFRNAAVEGYRTVADGFVEVLLFLISYGPSLLIWGVILFFPARAVWRRLQRNLI